MWFFVRVGLTMAVYQVIIDFAGKEMTYRDGHFWAFFVLMAILIAVSNLEGHFDAKKKAKS